MPAFPYIYHLFPVYPSYNKIVSGMPILEKWLCCHIFFVACRETTEGMCLCYSNIIKKTEEPKSCRRAVQNKQQKDFHQYSKESE